MSASDHIQLVRHMYDNNQIPPHFLPYVHKALSTAESEPHALELLKEQNHATGGGLFHWIAQKASNIRGYANAVLKGNRDDYPPDVRKMLAEMGNWPIKAMMVGRVPVQKMAQKMLNFVSMGAFEQLKQQMPYDDLYHVFLVFTTQVGNFVIEKNEVINLRKYTTDRSSQPGYGHVVVPILKEDTLNNILNRTRSNMSSDSSKASAFFTYDPFTNNCQVFLNAILTAAHQLGDISYLPSIRRFLFQDASVLAQNLSSFTKQFARSTTNLAHRVNILLKGRGFTPHNANQISEVMEAQGPFSRDTKIKEMDDDSLRGMWELSHRYDSPNHAYLRQSASPLQTRDRLLVINGKAGTTEFFNNFIDHPEYIQPYTEEEADQFISEGIPFVKFVNGFAVDPNEFMTQEEAEQASFVQLQKYVASMTPQVEIPAEPEP